MAAATTIVLQMLSTATAQSSPSRPITVIVAYPAGSLTDVVTRLYIDAVSKSLGQTILIDNRPGGGGIMGAQSLKQAAPDGHTLLGLSNGPLTTAPWMRSLPYDVSRDFEPVAALFGFSQFLTVSAESPVASIRELLEFAKKRQVGLTYSTLGVGSITHFLCASVAKESGTDMSHIPYTTLSQYLLDIATNRVEFTFSSYQQARSLEQDKKVRFLATTAPTRSPLRPNVPTTTELGFPNLNLGVWIALLAPAGTPAATIQRLNEHFAKAALEPHISDRLLHDGIDGQVIDPAATKALIASKASG